MGPHRCYGKEMTCLCSHTHSEANSLRAAIAQEVEQVVYYSEGCWFESQAPPAACPSILNQDTELQIATDAHLARIWNVCVCECEVL